MNPSELTTAIKNAMWDTLVENVGAPEDIRDEFVSHFPQCREFRFMGALGFGGKVWSNGGRYYVSYYPENRTPERDAMVEAANADLNRWSEQKRAMPSDR